MLYIFTCIAFVLVVSVLRCFCFFVMIFLGCFCIYIPFILYISVVSFCGFIVGCFFFCYLTASFFFGLALGVCLWSLFFDFPVIVFLVVLFFVNLYLITQLTLRLTLVGVWITIILCLQQKLNLTLFLNLGGWVKFPRLNGD